ncbi:MAG: thymidine kinase [Polyangiaceae bacterium]
MARLSSLRLAMAKLYFRYGTMDSAKTLNLLAVAHNYRKQGKRVLLLKPRLDVRFGAETIRSRSGLEAPADLLVEPDQPLDVEQLRNLNCILVDEAQFLSVAVIEQLRELTTELGVPVICYGLRTDFRTKLFPGSKRLLELADSIEEVKVTCQFCDRKAVFNLRMADGLAVIEGPQIQLGADERYVPACWRHYRGEMEKARRAAQISEAQAQAGDPQTASL